MASRQPRSRETWLVAILGAGILLLIAAKACHAGQRAWLIGHFTCRYTLEDDSGRREVVIHNFSGGRARQIGAGILAASLLCALWLLPTLRPHFWDTDLPKNRFLRLSLGTAGAAVLLIWPPWLVATSVLAGGVYFLLAEFAVWRWFARRIEGPRRATLKRLLFMANFMGIGLLAVARLGVDAGFAEIVAGILILHLIALRPKVAEAPPTSHPTS